MRYLTDQALFEAAGVRLAFTQRHGGHSSVPYASLNLSAHVSDDSQAVQANQRLALGAAGMGHLAKHLVNPVQVHSDAVCAVVPGHQHARAEQRLAACGCTGVSLVEPPTAPLVTPQADCVVSMASRVPAMLLFADCVPVVIVAPDGSFAVVHSGWRGTIKSIAGKAATVLAAVSGCDVRTVNAYIGPHIGACCYEVSSDLIDAFMAAFGRGCLAAPAHLDLGFAVRCALVRAGVRPERIVDAGVCTAHAVDDYFSYRAEHGVTGRFAAICCTLGQTAPGRSPERAR